MKAPVSAPIAKPRRVRCAAVSPQPWRNGGGQTRELLTCPTGAAWRLRLSVADIQADGLFSVFKGVQRWFVVLDGAGVGLRTAGQSHYLTPDSPPLRFSGDAAADCWLTDGPTRDLNPSLSPGCLVFNEINSLARHFRAYGTTLCVDLTVTEARSEEHTSELQSR